MGTVYRESIVHGSIRSRHVAQLFDSPESRVDSVAAFIEGALANGQTAVVIARMSHWEAIAGELEARGCPVERAATEGNLLVLDAASVLAAITDDVYPSAQLFERVIARELIRLSRGGELSVYGELVDLLAERGDFRAAVHLEALWNRLSERCSFTLLCGYSSAYFVGARGQDALRDICAADDRAPSGQADPLAEWILLSTH